MASYGYVVVAAFITIEGLGVPVPGELALLTAAAFAAQGDLSLTGVIAAASAGTILGGTGGYWIGHRSGPAVISRWGHWIGLTEARLAWARAFFARHGTKTVIVARFVAVLRVLVGVVAGLTHMPFGVFSVCNLIGGVLWSIVFGVLGFVFGQNLPWLEHVIRRSSLGVLAVVVLLAIGFIAWRRGRRRALPPPAPE